MEDFNPNLIAKKSIHGVFAFISRSFFLQIIGLVRDFLLAFFLLPATFGIYYLVESFIGIISYFSDIGLAGSLIQKKEAITQKELETAFTVQTLMVGIIICVVIYFSPLISNFLDFPKEGIYLIQAFVFAFFLSSLKTIPSVLLERNLEFGKFVIPQVVETLFYSITVVVLAWEGFGIQSFTYAVLARGISGLIAMYYIQSWKIRFGFSKDAFSHLASFGVWYQTNSILALIKDNLFVLFLGTILTKNQIGYIAFAQKYAFIPLRTVMDNVIRVTFSSFSRLQHDKTALGSAFEKSLTAGTALIFPGLIGVIFVLPELVHVIPKYHEKWEPTYIALLLFALNAGLASVLVPATNLLNAIGKIKITLTFMVLWTVIIWTVTPFVIARIGFEGYPLVSALINFSVVPIIYIVKKYVDFNTLRAIKNPFIASSVMGIVLFIISSLLTTSYLKVGALVFVGASTYFLILYLIAKEQMLTDIRFIKESLRK